MEHVNGQANGVSKTKSKAKSPPSELAQQATGEVTQVKLNRADFAPRVVTIEVTLESISSLIINNFNGKTADMMAEKQGQTVGSKRKKDPKDPVALFEAAKYIDEKGRDCITIGSFRNAMIAASRNLESGMMTKLKQAIFLEGEDGPSQTLIPIKYKRCVMRRDGVRLESGVADLRYRPEYQDWSVKLKVHVLQNVLSTVQVFQLIELAGFSVGVGEWRPSGKKGMGGPHGRFRISMK